MSVYVRATVNDRIVFVADTACCGLTDAEAVAELWTVAQRAEPSHAHVVLSIEQPHGRGRWTFYGEVVRDV